MKGSIEMSIKIALAGNPNCGKTTLFNALTGLHQHVGNWSGKTVEMRREVVRLAVKVVLSLTFLAAIR